MCNQASQEVEKVLYRVEEEIKGNLQLIIREPEVEDAQKLIDHLKVVDSETKFLAREPDEFCLDLEEEASFIRRVLEDTNTLMIVGEVDGQVIANCSVGLIMNKRRFLHRAAMGIAVRKDYWNLGIGRLLMQVCIKWCKDHAVEQLELEVVTVNNRAITMYENLGFKIHGTKKNALKYSDGTYADEYFMSLFLDEIK